jgi:hypothetical protein
VSGVEYLDDTGDYEEPIDFETQKKLMQFSINQLKMRIRGFEKAIENPEVQALRQKEGQQAEWQEDEEEFQVQKAS